MTIVDSRLPRLGHPADGHPSQPGTQQSSSQGSPTQAPLAQEPTAPQQAAQPAAAQPAAAQADRDPVARLEALFDPRSVRLLLPADDGGVLSAEGRIEGVPAVAFASDPRI